jgi:pyrimidine and pyridine-specific 5'-nucleotidase
VDSSCTTCKQSALPVTKALDNTISTMGSSERGGHEARDILFVDIDNCLYSRNKNVHDIMQGLIDKFFINHLSLSAEDALMLHQKYYQEYGLAIEGLHRHHKIQPLEFNQEVDDALPLDDILKPDLELRHLWERFDKTKVKMWLFTNAHITHGKRVVKLLGVEDCFEGITYCDYAAKELLCKPRPEMFEKAEREAGATSVDQCYFVGKVIDNLAPVCC